jgi:DNA adenine methylase
MSDLLKSLFELDDGALEKSSRETVLRAPFSYPGGKTKSVVHILQHLPYRRSYIEPFGGSAAILLARQPSELEVFNDRYAGVVAFYRCVRDSVKCQQLVLRLTDIVHSREEFNWCRDTWENYEDDVERAARWYYMSAFSFGSMGRNFGRATGVTSGLAEKTHKHILDFDKIHSRIKNILVENQDYKNILHDFDGEEAVFYLDPPYYKTSLGVYGSHLSDAEHEIMLNFIFRMQGFVAVSGYDNELYNKYPWDEKHHWEIQMSLKPMAFHEENCKSEIEDSGRPMAQETLWIKY